MKKTLMIALAGMMLFAFTQCGGNGNKQENESKTTNQTETTNEKAEKKDAVVNGTKQFTEMKNAYDEVGKAIKDVSNCDELEQIAMALVLSNLAIELGGDQYAEEERMTEKEQAKLKEVADKVLKDAEKKAEELGCEKKEYSL